MKLRIGLVSHSSLVGDAELALMAHACQVQLNAASDYWNRRTTTRIELGAAAAADPKAQLVHVFDHADQAGVLGYHDQDPSGRPYGRVFVDPVLQAGGSIVDAKDGPNTVSSVMSHEVLELWGDPQCQLWAQAPDGYLYALELADQVEGSSYEVTVGGGHVVPVSNWLTPAAFDPIPEAGDVLDYMGDLKAPFTVAPNGYAIRMKEGRVSQIWGDKGPLAWKRNAVMHPAARTARRAAANGALVVLP